MDRVVKHIGLEALVETMVMEHNGLLALVEGMNVVMGQYIFEKMDMVEELRVVGETTCRKLAKAHIQ